MSNPAVLISIRPEWVQKILSGEKTLEVRKMRPRMPTPFKVYIYQTLPKWGDWNEKDGRVVAEFTCNYISTYEPLISFSENRLCISLKVFGCLTDAKKVWDYANWKMLYGWHITDLKVYDKPKGVSIFYKWWHSGDDIRPCVNGKKCEHLGFDYTEDCEICKIDFDGENCPFLKLRRPPQSWCYVEELDI